MCRITVATLAVVSTLAFGTWPAWVQEIPKTLQGENSEQLMKDRINSWTVGIAAGNGSGTAFTFVEEMRRVLDDGDNMRVLPIVTRGIFDNIYDLLYLRGIDAAIVYGDVLEHFRTNAKIGSLEQRVNYIMPLFTTNAGNLIIGCSGVWMSIGILVMRKMMNFEV